MIIHRGIEQGSDKWFAVKLGKPSTSNFSRVLTNGRGKDSMGATAFTYAKDLAIERLTGIITDVPTNFHMERGIELEPMARKYYEDNYFENVELIGGIENHGYYCSTDGLMGKIKVLEIKCPKASTHFDYLLDNNLLIKKYAPQVQGELWLSEREICVLISFHPAFEKQVVIEVTRDEVLIKRLKDRLIIFDKIVKKYESQINKLN